jgi:predicted AAA+ superfamily ATPase
VDSPVVLIHGPRQCGKTTLAKTVGARLGHAYFSFDDDVLRASVRDDPVGFVADLPARVTLDEVQRVPGLFTALKVAVDRDRVPGRFLLTGSANVLLLPQLADSLAGRMSLLRLHPLAQCELEGHGTSDFLDALFDGTFKLRQVDRLGGALIDRVVAGGYPAALKRAPGARRAAWYRDYLESLVQRDVRDLARIASLHVLPRLLAAGAAQTAKLVNVSALAAPFQLTRPTIAEYVTLLERIFLLERIPPWHSNRLSRLVKTPKLHLGDSGLACGLLGVDTPTLAADRTALGPLLETFVVQELRRLASGHAEAHTFFHFRDKDGAEVDLVIERGARHLVGIEVKASATVTPDDFRGLRKLRDATGKRFAAGVVVYDGEASGVGFGDGMVAVSVGELWRGRSNR